MRKTYTINSYDNHLVINDNGRTILVDTGSPNSYFNGDSFEFCGQTIRKGLNLLGGLNPVSIESLSNLMHLQLDALIGYDLLKHFTLIIDYAGGTITFCDEEVDFHDGTELPMKVKMGIPTIELELNGKVNRFFLDTGAKVSYVPATATEGRTPTGTAHDFYPLLGEFDTYLYELETIAAGHTFNCQYGNLPAVLETTLGLGTGIRGIIGHDFFNHFVVLLDYRNKRLYIQPHTVGEDKMTA